MKILKTILIAATLLLSMQCHALVLTASPLEGEKEAEELYGPMAKILSEALGVEVIFDYSRDWQNFSKKIFDSSYDLILTDAHIIAYVTSYASGMSMDVMARLPGQIVYHVIVKSDNSASNLKSLSTSRICMLPSPNYSGVMIKKEFTNPVLQPGVREVSGNDTDVFNKFKQGGCDAAVINDVSFQQLTATGEPIKSIHQTRLSPNLGLAISQRIAIADRALIVKALQDPANKDKLAGIYDKFSSGKGPFENSDNKDYQDFNILPGVIWGW